MQLQEQYQRDSNSITHSPYYGCTVRVVSKAQVSYEGVLDGISINKDRIFLKNVRVKGNIINSSNRDDSTEKLDTLNTVMIDHLTNDMHVYEQVCLNVRDVQELKLIRLPSTFHESKVKLHAIDPCLVDIRLSSSNDHERMSNESLNKYHQSAPIDRRIRVESFGSDGNGGGALVSSSSNDSSSSFGYRPHDNFTDKSHDESYNDSIKKFSRLSTTTHVTPKPVTLLAKKVLPKKIERNNFRRSVPENLEPNFGSTQINNPNILKIIPLNNHRKASPIRVTITSKLNPNAIPFYGHQQRPLPATQNSSFTFYERNRFQHGVPQDRSQGISNRINTVNPSVYPQKNHHRFIPPRQMVMKKNFNNQTASSPQGNYRVGSSFPTKQQMKYKTSSHEQIPALMRKTPASSSTSIDRILSTPPIRERLSVPSYNRPHRSPANLCSTNSLPYQNRNSGEHNQLQMSSLFGGPIGSHRGQRTISGTSSGSSLSTDIGPHSIVQLDSTSNGLISTDGQYDFEKANEEFRRYLELEELVTRHSSPACSSGSHPDDNSNQQSQAHSYKKEVSFFDRISCTATTGTAVAYTEMDEVEKNLETFGDDALLINADANDDEWQI